MSPALPYALAFVLGTGFALLERPSILLIAILLLLWQERKKAVSLLPVIAAAFLLAHNRLPPEEATSGLFKPEILKMGRSPFGVYLLAQGKLKTDDSAFPCTIYLPPNGKRTEMNQDYWVEGQLNRRGRFQANFKVDSWRAVPNTFCLAEKRFTAKKTVRTYLKKRVHDKEALDLIAALATGQIMERSLAFDFGRLGLLHLLAISGFHFSLLALFIGKTVCRYLPPKIAGGILLLLLSLFFLYMGPTASVMRAGLSILFPLLGRFFNLKMPALNALSIACCAALLLDPLALSNLGFQLSYLATFGILTLYEPSRNLLAKLLPIRTKKEALRLSFSDKHGYLLASFFRSALALTLAVTATTLPLTLFVFGKFPLLSLIYNLFFPLGVTLLLFLLLTSFLCPPLFICTEATAKLLLIFTRYPPKRLDFVLHAPFLNLEIVILFLTVLISLSIQKKLHRLTFTRI